MRRAHELYLWQPEPMGAKRLPRVLAVHDLCGYGSCSLSTALPVLGAAGIKVCALPTAYLSAHTAFPSYSFFDTSSSWEDCLRAWQDIQLQFDAVYSGFLGNCQQAEVLTRVYEQQPQALRIVDPVMGDHGQIYRTYSAELCQAVRDLALQAQILSPNLTEAALLTGLPYPGEEPDEDALERLMAGLLELGVPYIILKAGRRGRKIRSYCFGPELERCCVEAEYIGAAMHGTGDLFASSLVAGIYSGQSLGRALELAMAFVTAAMRTSLGMEDWAQAGVSFEQELARFVQDLQLPSQGAAEAAGPCPRRAE